ncbi:MAG: dephospho-CoA kinase [Candidatus Saganbacteria bacterium]|nr:dephospho-CoA kinase [Candidatus Saganbacteria bacterium]
MKNKKLIIGVTGPIASGKSLACRALRSMGCGVIDADLVGHKLLKRGSPAFKKVINAFPGKDICRGAQIDRKKLGGIVFGDRRMLKKLERITHPLIKKEIERRISKIQNRTVVVNAAVLEEIGLAGSMDKIIAVVSGKGKRLARLMKKMSRTQALSRMRAQRSDKDYIKKADVVIRNDSSAGNLIKKTKEALKKIIPG